MAENARDSAQYITSRLERRNAAAVGDLRKNLSAFIANTLACVEQGPEVNRAAASVRTATERYLSASLGAPGLYDKSAKSEPLRMAAVQAAQAFEETVVAAPASPRVKDL
ncbi:hypothetical protein GTW51_14840 [Aurantimonas aggregata]|uniref:Uncharacterized protein n=1 Tax=Aurantimonas aggregata TaxID=2047720 RepID=A0A6L9MKG7_9HYPH|nr:hypothetical protein [Aurantimonas aggregata]NDV87980.1 hypothetical protein [Aurantimonas aggregata]